MNTRLTLSLCVALCSCAHESPALPSAPPPSSPVIPAPTDLAGQWLSQTTPIGLLIAGEPGPLNIRVVSVTDGKAGWSFDAVSTDTVTWYGTLSFPEGPPFNMQITQVEANRLVLTIQYPGVSRTENYDYARIAY